MYRQLPRSLPHYPALGLLLVCVLCCTADIGVARADSPMEALRENIGKGIAVLRDPRYDADTERPAQRERLCAIAQEMFDPSLFSKLALGANWGRFSGDEQKVFVDSFAHYLCRYYLSRLQQRYTDENIAFVEQAFKSDKLATVKVEVLWQDARVPVEVKMALRDGRWRAYDIVFMGVSAVMVYRTQFNDALANDTPAALIDNLRSRSTAVD